MPHPFRPQLFLGLWFYAGMLLAQSPLTPVTGQLLHSGLGGAGFFDLHVATTVSIHRIDTMDSMVAGYSPFASVLEIWLGPGTYRGNTANPGQWTLVSTASRTTSSGTSVFLLPTPLCLGPGDHAIALKSVPANSSAGAPYGFRFVLGTGNAVPGSGTNQTSSTAEMTLRGGAYQSNSVFLTGEVSEPLVLHCSIHYSPGGTPTQVAGWERYGDGCVASYRSFFELFWSPLFIDLSHSSIHLQMVGNTYVVGSGATPVVPQSATAAVAAFANGEASVSATALLGGPLPFPIRYPGLHGVATTNDLEINADGFVSPTTNSWSNPLAYAFTAWNARWCPFWKNMYPLGGTNGNVTAEVEAGSGALVVSWNASHDNSGLGTSTFQIAFWQNGDVDYRYGVLSPGGGLPILVGWSAGQTIERRLDLSLALPNTFTTATADHAPLGLVADQRPLLGSTPNLIATNCPTGTVLGVSMLSFTRIAPAVSLAPFGAPDCWQLQGGESVQIVVPVVGGQFTQAFTIPNIAAASGMSVYSQAAALVPGVNALGVEFSSGLLMRLGSW
jgi:hypothetical protein